MWQTLCYAMSWDIFAEETHVVLVHVEFKPSYISPQCFQAQAFSLDIENAAPLDGLKPVVCRETSSEGVRRGREERKPWFVTFANFNGVNIPAVDDFKLPMVW